MRSFQVCTCGAAAAVQRSIRRRKPTGTEVLLKVLAAGVCHSDLHLSDGYFDLGGGKRMSLRRPRHEAAGDARPRERRRGRRGRARTRKGVKVGDARAGASLDRLRRLRGLPARRRKPLPRHEEPRRVLQRRLLRPTDAAASALSDRHRRPAAGARRAARLLGRHHLRRAEEGRPDADDRADRDHRRRRPRPDVHRAPQGDGRQERHRRRHRSGQARSGQKGRRRRR